MTRVSLRSGAATLALACLVAVGMTAAPLTLTDDSGLTTKTAEAKNGKGGGNDKGGRGGNDKGGRGGNDKGGKGGKGGNSGNSANAGNSKSSLDSAEEDIDTAEVEDEYNGKVKGMGSLSASNASQRARERASPNSRPGALGEYERALAEGEVEAAAAALARAANKEITPEKVGAVNHNLGVEATPEEEAQMAALAEAARTAEPGEEGEPEGEEAAAEAEGSEGEGSGEDGLDEIAAAAEDLIGGEDADDWEVH